MRTHTLMSFATVGLAIAIAGWGLAAPNPGIVFADKSSNAVPVDTELVIAVDVSNSMDLDVYYGDCVIGGPGAFVVAIKQREQFKDATRTKLVQEIAGVPNTPRIVPAQARSRAFCY